ncbi:MAG: hypothetical protein IT561_05435 [Alphaproteobacteria bacterium]|nr:hypothetical protein [Alphaproteobacteria bacterium]
MGDVIELFGAQARPSGWTEQEKAELYRAASLLGARGLPFDTESGVSDDGDPWFLFVGRGTGEVLVHFARIDGAFVVHHSAADVVFRADDIRELVDRVLLSPDRAAGRATGDAVYSHLAATVSALALSTLALDQFDQFVSAPTTDGDDGEPAPAPVSAAATLLDDHDSTAGSDSVAGDGDDGSVALSDDPVTATPDIRPVDVPEQATTALDTVDDADRQPGSVPAAVPVVDLPPVIPNPDPVAFTGIVVEAGAADDTLVGTDRDDFLSGGAGNDLILAGKGNDIVLGGDGNDTVDAGAGNDVVLGGLGNDIVYGGQGDDLLIGGAGDDLLHGGKGDDTLQGTVGYDTLAGDDGDDLLIATDGDAVMLGGSGTNIFHFAPGEATAFSGPGRDIFVYEEGERTDVVIHDFDPDHDVLIFLDTAGHVVDLPPPERNQAGETDIAPANGGSLRILFAEPDDLLS